MIEPLLDAMRYRCIGPPRGGRVVAVADGVWKTGDAGVTWANVSDGYLKTSAVGALAVPDYSIGPGRPATSVVTRDESGQVRRAFLDAGEAAPVGTLVYYCLPDGLPDGLPEALPADPPAGGASAGRKAADEPGGAGFQTRPPCPEVRTISESSPDHPPGRRGAPTGIISVVHDHLWMPPSGRLRSENVYISNGNVYRPSMARRDFSVTGSLHNPADSALGDGSPLTPGQFE